MDITTEFMEVEGASKRPNVIEYPSVHCDIYRSWSSVHLLRQGRFLCANFTKLPQQHQVPCGNVGCLIRLAFGAARLVWHGQKNVSARATEILDSLMI